MCCYLCSKKEKKAVRAKPSKLKVILLRDFPFWIPRGNQKKVIEKDGRLKQVTIFREMSYQEVQEEIRKHFRAFSLKSFQIYESSQSGRLFQMNNQSPDGNSLVESVCRRKVPIYIYENSSEKGGESSARGESSALEEARAAVAELKKPVVISVSDSESDNQDDVHLASVKTSKEKKLEEFRKLRALQDHDYAASLNADKLKDAKKRHEQEQLEKSQSLRKLLQNKFSILAECGITIAFRLPNGSKIEHTFPPGTPCQSLYEFVYASAQFDDGFSIYQILPRKLIECCPIQFVEDTLPNQEKCLLQVEACNGESIKLAALHTLGVEESSELIKSDHEVLLRGGRDVSTLISERCEFMKTLHSMQKSARTIHPIHRDNVFKDVLGLYKNNVRVVCEYPLEIAFVGEKGVDHGGLCRDLFSGFWEKAYSIGFDGGSLIVPCVRPDTDVSILPLFGRIISHGYLTTGFLPLRIAFPSLASILLGSTINFPDRILINAFKDSISCYEASILKDALMVTGASFKSDMINKVLSVLSRFGCVEVPTPSTLKQVITKIAKYEFLCKPLAALTMIRSGIPSEHLSFWEKISVTCFHEMVSILGVTPAKVICLLDCEPLTPNEQRSLQYLEMFIGNMNQETLAKFLRFVTGSSVCCTEKIEITFNGLRGLARRPISHTCDCSLELPTTYDSYVSFTQEFEAVLANTEYCWDIDAY